LLTFKRVVGKIIYFLFGFGLLFGSKIIAITQNFCTDVIINPVYAGHA